MEPGMTYAALVATCFVVPALLFTRGPLYLLGEDGLWARAAEQLDRRAARHPRPLDDDELAALTAWAVRRSFALARNLERLARILATDAAMSATRQIANRLAYAQLLREARDVPEPPWPDLPADLGGPQDASRTLPGRPDVELLDVGWKWGGTR